MCVRCGTGRIAWCTSPDRHASAARPRWYEAYMYARRPGSPGCPDHRVQVDARITFEVTLPAGLTPAERRARVRDAAEGALRALGLGYVMGLPGVRVEIDPCPL